MQISNWFTGAVFVDAIAVATEASRATASMVHFTPGARTAWHTHPKGQTIYVTEGVGLAQHRDLLGRRVRGRHARQVEGVLRQNDWSAEY